jgi:hypothetical protein
MYLDDQNVVFFGSEKTFDPMCSFVAAESATNNAQRRELLEDRAMDIPRELVGLCGSPVYGLGSYWSGS